MKKLQTSVAKVLFSSILVVGMGMVVVPASAGTVLTYAGFSDVMQLASTDFKGEHRYTSHVAYERHSKELPAQLEEMTGIMPVSFRGKPPYNRHIVKQQPLEKVQFARFEESTGVARDVGHSIYRGSHNQRPPYRR